MCNLNWVWLYEWLIIINDLNLWLKYRFKLKTSIAPANSKIGLWNKIDDVCMWILLLLCISIKTPCCWAQMTFVCWEPALNRSVLLLSNCDAQWRIQSFYQCMLKSDAMSRHTYGGFEFEFAGLSCPCCFVRIISV